MRRDCGRCASVAQDRPILQQREVVGERVRNGLVLPPRMPHDERHKGDEWSGSAVDVAQKKPDGARAIARSYELVQSASSACRTSGDDPPSSINGGSYNTSPFKLHSPRGGLQRQRAS